MRLNEFMQVKGLKWRPAIISAQYSQFIFVDGALFLLYMDS